ncbi:MAG: glyceraldehyde-3-phosphate dehydrogenase [Flavobacteriales bacterium]|jgi:glyceraldehyde 3-phosphate dehydrogenase|nr:glyceraldehyde-3-phosphate dehydrogenase [Flavobacteriales bacterium]MBT5090200.1 glyceraldehyde-3-phosphate dehydrogenase [Flavobacteriales bacterium]
MSASYELKLNDWINKEKLGVNLLNSVGTLMYDKGIELVLFRNQLLEIGVSELMNTIFYANNVVNRKVNIETAAALANEMLNLDLAPSKLDIGLLSAEYFEQDATDVNAFLTEKLANFIGTDKDKVKPKDVILYGFGRIGRLAARELVKQAGKGQQLRLKAIVVRRLTDAQIIKRADLLRNDSVHGAFKGVVDVDLPNQAILVNGQVIKLIDGGNPEDIDYTIHGIDNALLIDNTGAFTDKEALSIHLQSKGVNKVLLTAPGKGIPNIVYGINSKEIDVDATDIFSAASCTTNCIAPILHVVENKYGVNKGHLETVHSYTNDQNLLDNMHNKPRRGRSAAINMVITSTGAGNAVTKVIPSLVGKLSANAVRVPTPNVSLAILKLNLNKATSLKDINETIREAALKGSLVNQINYQIDPELVSTDVIGNNCCSVYDSKATIVTENGEDVVLYVWYDNEFGYTKQVIRLAKLIAKVRRLTYY